MKKILFISILIFLFINRTNCQNGVAINTTGTNADASAMLDISSSTSGFLIPRMTTAERNAISNPAEGLQIFNTVNKCTEIFIDGLWRSTYCIDNFQCGSSYVNFIYNGNNIIYGTVKGQNGTCWLDKNLGALSVATAYNHSNSYGDLFQWGRLNDGHQIKSSLQTTAISSTNNPGHNKFITNLVSPYDWLAIPNNMLWQGVSGINNPCPNGWRIPTALEFDAERTTWSPQSYIGAFASQLKLTAAGYRDAGNGSLNSTDIGGFYWTSTTSNNLSRYLNISNTSAYLTDYYRGSGLSIRCIKEY